MKHPYFQRMNALTTDFIPADYFGESNIETEVEERSLFPIAPAHSQLTPDGDFGYSPILPVELALKTASVDELCTAYGLTPEQFAYIVQTPAFVADYKAAQELVKEEGMSFRLKARIQAEEMLKTSWNLVHNVDTPPSVRADLIKWTCRVANLEPAKEQQNPFTQGGGLNIQINLG